MAKCIESVDGFERWCSVNKPKSNTAKLQFTEGTTLYYNLNSVDLGQIQPKDLGVIIIIYS